MDIWVWEPTGNPAAEFPLDDCSPSLEASVKQDTGSESSSSDEDVLESLSSSNDEDAPYNASSRLWPTSNWHMWKRNNQTIVYVEADLTKTVH
ncbi:hypothetical protein FRC06_000718 [Ceratobasidium sp. 370]|nr:hypothetical protein FRC06_000718 [Ceratobasidium sp. 370]